MKSKAKTYQFRQWKKSFSILFVGIFTVLTLLALSLLISLSFNNIQQHIINDIKLSVDLEAGLTDSDKLQLIRQIGVPSIVKQIDTEGENSLSISFVESKNNQLEQIEKYSKDISLLEGVQKAHYPHATLEVITQSFKYLKAGTIFSLGLIAIIGCILIHLILYLLIYSKRYHIYNMKLVGAKERFIVHSFMGKVFWCSLAAGLFTSLFILISFFAASIAYRDLLKLIELDTVYYTVILIPILSILINTLNTELLVSKFYRLTSKDLNRI